MANYDITKLVLEGFDANRYTMEIPATDKTLTQEDVPADAKAVRDALNSVDVDTVNNARQLLSESYVLDQEPYLFRASGGEGADRVEECIVGGSVGWNQLVRNGDFSDGANYWSKSDNSDSYSINNGIYTLTLSSAPVNYYGHRIQNNTSTSISGHKVLCSCYMRSNKQCGFTIGITNSTPASGLSKANTADQWTQVSNIMSVNTDGAYSLQCTPGYSYSELSAGDTIDVKEVMVIDLTTLFGSTIADYIYSLEQSTAGAGVSYFRKLFPNDFYEYSAPTLKHVEGVSAKEVVGKNLLNLSESEMVSDGWNRYFPIAITAGTYIISCQNQFGASGSKGARVALADDTNTTIKLLVDDYLFGGTFFVGNAITITADEAAKIKRIIFELRAGGTTYADITQGDIQLEIGTEATPYEPYHKNIYPLDSTLTLRGVPKLTDGKMCYDGDKYNADGTVERRYGIVDLGTLNWTVNNHATLGDYFYANVAPLGIKYKGAFATTIYQVICLKYAYTKRSAVDFVDKSLTYDGSTGNVSQLQIKDSDHSDAATFKTAMSGVYLVYELATPTTETATPYTSIQMLDPHGTEEFVSTGIVPVGHESHYLENLRAKIEGLPRDFSTLIAPTEETYKATQNYTVGSLLIVDNILYKVTANIANGATITPNTNVTAKPLSEIIAELA